MPRLKHIDLKDYPYMTTTVILNREPILNDTEIADIMLKVILSGSKQKWYYLLSFVIMPEHIHLVIIPEGKKISECMKSVKGFSGWKINKKYNKKGSIWQSGFYNWILDSQEKVLSRIKYIEENPVRKGIVERPEDYKYSSAGCRDETDFGRYFKHAGQECPAYSDGFILKQDRIS